MPPRLPRRIAHTLGRARHLAGERAGHRGDVRLVVDSGLLDRAWVGLQLGRTLGGDEEAAEAVLASQDISPHPLLELRAASRAAVPGGRSDAPPSLLDYLGDPGLRASVVPHPLVDLGRLQRAVRTAPPHPGGPLAAWLAQATPGSLVPTPDGVPSPTLADLRSYAEAATREHRRLHRLTRPPRTVEPLPDPGPQAAVPDPPPGLRAAGVPLVSVVLATWDRGPLLRRSIESVIAQSFAAWELIVVDDGSTDDTPAVLDGLGRFEPRLTSVRVPHAGVGRARNEGVARARGTYLAFLDADTAWQPDFLRTMLARLVAGDLAMAHGAVRERREGVDLLSAFQGGHEHLLARSPVDRPLVDLNALVVRRDALLAVGGFAEDLRRFVDHDLVLRLAAAHPLQLVPYVAVEPEPEREDPHERRAAEAVREAVAAQVGDTESGSWLSVVLERHLVDWTAPTPPPVAGRTSVVLAAGVDLAAAVGWMLAFLADSREEPEGLAELIVVSSAGGVRDRADHVVAGTLARLDQRVRLVPLAVRLGPGVAWNLGIGRATGDRVVLARPAVLPDPVAATALADALEDPRVALVQPVFVAADDVVAGAGAVFGARSVRPEVFLEHHAVRDLGGETLGLPAPLGPVVALRTADARRLRGVDPLLGDSLPEVELGLRMHREGVGRVVVDPAVRMRSTAPELAGPARLLAAIDLLELRGAVPVAGSERLWSAVGFEVLGHRNHPVRPHAAGRFNPAAGEQVTLVPRAVVRAAHRAERLRQHPPRLRWSIDTAAPAGPRGAAWGDTHFAGALRDALERRGQQVAVDPRQARHRPTRDFDDVVLVLRGLDRVQPRPGLVNVEWVISHPDLVTRDELAGVDLAYAASGTWALARTAQWGLSVRPLLQCTDASLFHPERAAGVGDSPAVLFVGNSRGVYRSSLRAAIAAGADVEVHGVGWRELLPAGALASEHLENAELGRLYASAGVVLNDHHEDMRREGFLSNRLFDAGACGARIISDEVAGAQEIFGPLLRTFHADADLPALLRDPASAFGSREERVARARVIAAEHSFDRRAETLVYDVAALLATRPGPPPAPGG